MDPNLILQIITIFLEEYITPYTIADYQGEPFRLYDLFHLVALGSILLVIILIVNYINCVCVFRLRMKYCQTTERG